MKACASAKVEASPGVVQIDQALVIETLELGGAELVEGAGLRVRRVRTEERSIVPIESPRNRGWRRHGKASLPLCQPNTGLAEPKAERARTAYGEPCQMIASPQSPTYAWTNGG